MPKSITDTLKRINLHQWQLDDEGLQIEFDFDDRPSSHILSAKEVLDLMVEARWIISYTPERYGYSVVCEGELQSTGAIATLQLPFSSYLKATTFEARHVQVLIALHEDRLMAKADMAAREKILNR
jgi:hypothetical protein